MTERSRFLNLEDVVCVGNTGERLRLEQLILKEEKVCIAAPPCSGKLTAVLYICHKHHIPYTLYYNSDPPLEDLIIIRNPDEKIIKKFANRWTVFLCDKEPCTKIIIRLKPPTDTDMMEYERQKGMLMARWTSEHHQIIEARQVIEVLRGLPTPVPDDMHRLIARNFYKYQNILRLCDLAQQLKGKFYEQLMRAIKIKHDITLKPVGAIKRK